MFLHRASSCRTLLTNNRSRSWQIRCFKGQRIAQLRERLRLEELADRRQQEQLSPVDSTSVGSRPALTDSFGRHHTYLRISLTERCNLRCTYCMPEEGVPLTPSPSLLGLDEMLRLVKLFIRLGVRKIRLTGGEPTLRPDLVDICAALRALDGVEILAMTSNGVLLSGAAKDKSKGTLLEALRCAGLDRLNLSLDTLRRERFEKIVRRPMAHWDRVMESVRLAQRLGFSPLKVNVVIARGVNDDEVLDFVEFASSANITVRSGGDLHWHLLSQGESRGLFSE